MKQENTLDISWESIFKIFVTVLIFYLLYLVKNVLMWFVFAVIISVLFEALIIALQKKRIPRVISALIVYFVVFGLISVLIYSTIPIFISEIRQFAQGFPQYFEKIVSPLKELGFQAFKDIENFVDFLSKNLEDITANIFKTASAIFGGVLSTFFIFSVAFFLSLEEKPVEKALILLFPKKYEAYILNLWKKCQNQVSEWFLSRVLGCLFVAFLAYVSFLIFKTKYPFLLGLLVGILDFIPIIGPITGGVLIFIIVSLDSFMRAIFVVLVFILIQQIENNIFLPLLTKRFTGMSPVVVLLALTIGGILWGIWGSILAIPLFGIINEFLKDYLQKRREENTVVL